MIVVLMVFLILLLSLGYLLKENENTTTQLKQKLEQERVQQQLNSSSAREVKIELRTTPETPPVELAPASSKLQLQQNIIIENLTCYSDQQCVLVVSELAGEQCWLAVNTIKELHLYQSA